MGNDLTSVLDFPGPDELDGRCDNRGFTVGFKNGMILLIVISEFGDSSHASSS
jgi:hypothetical protein